ncbi:energy transducer TonB [Leptothrix sp. BB-4]
MARDHRLTLSRRHLPAAVLLAVAGHAALLLSPWDAGPGGGHAVAGTGVRAGQPSARVRMLAVDEAPGRAAPSGQPDDTAVSMATSSATASTAPIDPTAAGAAGPASDAAGLAPSPAQAPDDESLFLVRSQLDRPPWAASPVDLPYPDSAPLGHYAAVMTLFIDESGKVRRVRLDAGSVLPPLLEDAARQAFLKASFEPGQKGGAAVRSRMKVAVEFGADAPAPP